MDFLKFLVQAKRNTYPVADQNDENILDDGSKELSFSKDNFRYRDRYFGPSPFIGEEIVWQGDKKIWGMNYYGVVISKIISSRDIFRFLKIAMKNVTEESPFRGPNNFQDKNFEYFNNSDGDIDFFKGEERINYKKQEVYKLYYHGGRM